MKQSHIPSNIYYIHRNINTERKTWIVKIVKLRWKKERREWWGKKMPGGTNKKTGARTRKPEERVKRVKRTEKINRKEEDDRTRKAKTDERKQCWWNSLSTPPSSFASSRFQEQTKKEKRERDREREDRQTTNKEGGNRPARANRSSPSSSSLPRSCSR